MRYSVKCIGKSRDIRRIRVTINKKKYEVSLFQRQLVMPFETKDNAELHKFLEGIVLEHVYWLFGLDLGDMRNQKEQEASEKYSDRRISYSAEDWYKETKNWIDFYCKDLKAYSDYEREYLYANIGEDYYRNRSLYPSFFDFKEFYNIKDLKII